MKDVNILKNNGVDVEKSLELFGDMEMYDDTVNDFLDQVGKKLADIKRYKEISDMKNYAILVHSLKSDAKYLGFTVLADLSYQHELKSKANDVAFVIDNYDKLVEETNRIIALCKKYVGNVTDKEVVNSPVIIKDKTILAVDDSNIIVNFIKKIFNDTFEVIVASDGEKAIDILKDNPNKAFVGMLLDLNMPNVDGFAVLDYFKENHLFDKIPVSIITGGDSRETITKAFTYQITELLPKPFNERDVKRVVEKMTFVN